MRSFLSCFLIGIATLASKAQFVSIDVEPYIIHDGPTPDGVNLSGYTTYRLYVQLTNASDFCSSVYGDVEFPLRIESSTGFWNSPFGGLTASDINPALIPFFPSLEYDSFVTIGKTNSGEPGGIVNSIESECDPWTASFNAGGPIEMDCLFGGAWFALNGDVNGQAGQDLRVLIGQFTTNGVLAGTINVQIFPLGVGANEQRISGISFSSNQNAVFGCIDPLALNYNSEADQNDGSCVYPCALSVESVEITPNNCAGEANAALFVHAAGGQGPITYRLNGGFMQVSPFFDGLSAGLYEIVAEDGQGCTSTYELILEDPEVLAVTLSVAEAISCAEGSNGEISVVSAGGTGDILFGLSPDEIFNTMPSFNNLSAGEFVVYARDSNGCTAQSEVLFLEGPEAISVISISTSASDCGNNGNGSLSIVASGGTGQKTYSLDGINYQSDGAFSGLSTGTYVVYIQDSSQCQTSVSVFISGPEPVIADPIVTNNFCAQGNEGTVDLNLSGGTGNLLISYNNGPFVAEEEINGLSTGVHEVEVLDQANACQFSLQFEIGGGPEVLFGFTSTDLLCEGYVNGTLTIQAEGGYGNLQYALQGDSFGTDNEFENLGAGVYSVVIADQEGCLYEFEAEVVSPDPIVIIGNSLMEEEGAGQLNLEVSGGVQPYVFAWIGPDGFVSDQQNLSSLSQGNYEVTITDANDCVATEVFNLSVGINESSSESKWVVFPNPALDKIQLMISSPLSVNADIFIHDMQGKLLKRFLIPSGVLLFDIELQGLAAGMYNLTLTTGTTQFKSRISKN
jgi:hypothetical protein